MRMRSIIGAAWLLFAFTCACSSTSTDSSGSAKPSDESGGKHPVGTFICKGNQKGACVDPTDRFDAAAEVIHLIYTTKDLPKKGDTYVTKWIAEDVGDAAPASSVVATYESTVGEILAGTVSYTVEGELKKPTKGFPKGSYRVDVMLGEKVVTSAKFKVE